MANTRMLARFSHVDARHQNHPRHRYHFVI